MQVATTQSEKNVQEVREYDLFLDVDFSGLKYSGKVVVDLESIGDVSLDAVGQQISSVKSSGNKVPFKHSGKVLEIQTGKFSGPLEIDFSGRVSDNFTGLYKASYGDGYILSTHLEAVQARKVLPCVDHPAFKAVFKVRVRTDADLSVISNMPIESETRQGEKKTVMFKKTPKMSTYLLYLGVGKFVQEKNRHGETELYAAYADRPTGKINTEFSFDATRKVLDFYESYFGIPFQLPKLHNIAVPEFAYGAMENWGAITYREILLHVDKDTSVRARKSVAHVIAHEIAHMWFGDLVTMRWWDDLWLNESFATFMDFKSTDRAYPEWKVWQDFVRTSTSGAMGRDALTKTHPIMAKVHDPEEIEELFDEISYGKGASILRMIEAYVGPENFKNGVRQYLEKFRYGNASGHDLWSSLQEASGTDVSRIMEGWISQEGFPVVKASLADGRLTLEQERFLLTGGTSKQTWPIPVTMNVDGKTQSLLLDKKKAEVNLPTTPRSLKLNVDQTGFYVVQYNGKELLDLVWKSGPSPLDRWGLISDAKAFLLSGRTSFKEYIKLVEKYQNEEEYLPAVEVSDQLSFLYQIAPSELVETSRKFHSAGLRIFENRKDDNSTTLKGIIAARLTLLDDAYAKKAGSKLNDLANVEPDMKRSVVMGYARSSNDYDGLISRYTKSTTDEERLRYLEGLASFKNPELVAKTLDFALSGKVKRQDVRNVILYATANPDAKTAIWQWFKNNMAKLEAMYSGTAQFSIILREYFSIVGVGRLAEVEKFFSEHKVTGADIALERLRIYDQLARNITATP
ncbi:MAG TPA: M1 family metallopeptidase [Candidatus Bathyarchaeia archaeon]|nr:M1 family metallopeptidase [Candidatus Bathyarchaeia archaeon]